MVRILLLLLLVPLTTVEAAWALTCNSLGRPSYTAERTTREEGRVVSRTRVYASRAGEREEVVVNGQKQVTLILREGTYTYNEATRTGLFAPKPRIQRQPDRQITATKVGANTLFSEIVQSDAGGQGIGDTLLCSPQGVPLKREYVAPTPNRQLRRYSMTHSNIRIGRLPASLFKVPGNIQITRAQPRG